MGNATILFKSLNNEVVLLHVNILSLIKIILVVLRLKMLKIYVFLFSKGNSYIIKYF